MCHSERSVTESNPQGNGKAVGIPKRKVDTLTYLTLPRLDYDVVYTPSPFAVTQGSTTLDK